MEVEGPVLAVLRLARARRDHERVLLARVAAPVPPAGDGVEEDVGLLADRVAPRLEVRRVARAAAVAGVRPERERVAPAPAAVRGVDGPARVGAVVAGEDPGAERVVEV